MSTRPVLTSAATLQCAHGGQVQLIATQQSLGVDGNPVILFPDLVGAAISGCTTPTASNPPTKQCLVVTSVLDGAAQALSVAGKPVATDRAQGLTDGFVGPAVGTWRTVFAGQTKLVTR